MKNDWQHWIPKEVRAIWEPLEVPAFISVGYKRLGQEEFEKLVTKVYNAAFNKDKNEDTAA